MIRSSLGLLHWFAICRLRIECAAEMPFELWIKQAYSSWTVFCAATNGVRIHCKYKFTARYRTSGRKTCGCTAKVAVDVLSVFGWFYPYKYLFGDFYFIAVLLQNIVSDDLFITTITWLYIYITLVLLILNTYYATLFYRVMDVNQQKDTLIKIAIVSIYH